MKVQYNEKPKIKERVTSNKYAVRSNIVPIYSDYNYDNPIEIINENGEPEIVYLKTILYWECDETYEHVEAMVSVKSIEQYNNLLNQINTTLGFPDGKGTDAYVGDKITLFVDDFPAMVAEPYVQEIIGEESLVELKKGEADWNPDIDEWLEIGDKRVYDGKLWKVNIAHQPDYLYPPPTVPALYSEVDFEGIIGNWRQPLGAHDAYMLGMQCYHNNELWTSQIDYNTSEPGTVPELNLWKKDGGQDPDNLCETAYPWTEDIWLTIKVDEFAKYLNKVYKCIDPAWAYLEPTNTYGYLGWIFEQDCET